jgi:hypothetical protein
MADRCKYSGASPSHIEPGKVRAGRLIREPAGQPARHAALTTRCRSTCSRATSRTVDMPVSSHSPDAHTNNPDTRHYGADHAARFGGAASICDPRGMNRVHPLRLTVRRHVDLRRVTSASCRVAS